MGFKLWTIAHGIKQKEISELLGISLPTVSLKLNCKTDWKMSEIQKLINAYGVSPNIFFE